MLNVAGALGIDTLPIANTDETVAGDNPFNVLCGQVNDRPLTFHHALQHFQHAGAVFIPILGQHMHDLPSEGTQQFRPQNISFQDVSLAIIPVRVDQNAQAVGEIVCPAHSQIAAKARLANVRFYEIAALMQGGGEGSDTMSVAPPCLTALP